MNSQAFFGQNAINEHIVAANNFLAIHIGQEQPFDDYDNDPIYIKKLTDVKITSTDELQAVTNIRVQGKNGPSVLPATFTLNSSKRAFSVNTNDLKEITTATTGEHTAGYYQSRVFVAFARFATKVFNAAELDFFHLRQESGDFYRHDVLKPHFKRTRVRREVGEIDGKRYEVRVKDGNISKPVLSVCRRHQSKFWEVGEIEMKVGVGSMNPAIEMNFTPFDDKDIAEDFMTVGSAVLKMFGGTAIFFDEKNLKKKENKEMKENTKTVDFGYLTNNGVKFPMHMTTTVKTFEDGRYTESGSIFLNAPNGEKLEISEVEIGVYKMLGTPVVQAIFKTKVNRMEFHTHFENSFKSTNAACKASTVETGQVVTQAAVSEWMEANLGAYGEAKKFSEEFGGEEIPSGSLENKNSRVWGTAIPKTEMQVNIPNQASVWGIPIPQTPVDMKEDAINVLTAEINELAKEHSNLNARISEIQKQLDESRRQMKAKVYARRAIRGF